MGIKIKNTNISTMRNFFRLFNSEVVIPAKSVLSTRNPSLMISRAVLSEAGIRVKRVRFRGAENSVHVSEEFPRASIMITLLSKVGLICDISSR